MKKDVFAQIFDYEGHKVRLIERDEKAWWVLADVCEILGLANPTIVSERLETEERAKLDLGRQGETWCVNEPGLYRVIMRSDKPDARKFQHWVFHDVLPVVMGTKKYVSPERKKFNNKVRYLSDQLRDFARLNEEADISAERERIKKYFHELIGQPLNEDNSITEITPFEKEVKQ